MKIINSERIPIKCWLDDLEPAALEQAKNLARHPYSFSHIAIMPDAHVGYGMPIGAVMASKSVIIPNAVGVDIGCGVCALRTSLKEIKRDTLRAIMREIKRQIPLGFNRHKQAQKEEFMPKLSPGPIVSRQYKKALEQIGTLGGGNHFIEIQAASDGHIWLMIHSGSRNLGKQVADYYNRQAIKLNEKIKAPIPLSWQLAYLPLDSQLAKSYIKEMNYCVEFALNNRKLMMKKIVNIFQLIFKKEKIIDGQLINIAHNYAKMENHFTENLMVHRKGATLADINTIGIIPGSQGMDSYIVKGLANPDSFKSCSHGAGRKMSRQAAKRKLDLKTEKDRLDKRGIIHSLDKTEALDEASGAYKEIETVMKNQADLVEILLKLKPLMVVKA